MTHPLDAWRETRPVLGMVHLLPLPGAPRYRSDPEAIRGAALRDAEALAEGGVHGVIVENYGDAPFFPWRVPAETIAHMTRLVAAVKEATGLPIGVNVLRNDGRGALAVAHAAGADLIRVNVLCGARVTDQGVIEGIAHDLLRDRARLGARDLRILADVDVKHSAPLGPASLGPASLEGDVEDAIARGGADAIIVSGRGTGKETDPDAVRRARGAAAGVPLFIGSGATPETARDLLAQADGLIVGTYFKRDGIVTNPVDPERVEALMARVG